MSVLAELGRGAAGGIIGGIGSIIDNLHTSDEERAAAKQRAAELVSGTMLALVDSANVEMEAKKAVLVAELQQGDNYTKRARPTIIYGGLAFIAINYVAFPLIGRLVAVAKVLAMDNFDKEVYGALLALSAPLADLPGPFWAAWGGIAGTWVLGRSLERGGVTNQIMSKLAGLPSADDKAPTRPAS